LHTCGKCIEFVQRKNINIVTVIENVVK
jgi:hypothetical protein